MASWTSIQSPVCCAMHLGQSWGEQLAPLSRFSWTVLFFCSFLTTMPEHAYVNQRIEILSSGVFLLCFFSSPDIQELWVGWKCFPAVVTCLPQPPVEPWASWHAAVLLVLHQTSCHKPWGDTDADTRFWGQLESEGGEAGGKLRKAPCLGPQSFYDCPSFWFNLRWLLSGQQPVTHRNCWCCQTGTGSISCQDEHQSAGCRVGEIRWLHHPHPSPELRPHTPKGPEPHYRPFHKPRPIFSLPFPLSPRCGGGALLPG